MQLQLANSSTVHEQSKSNCACNTFNFAYFAFFKIFCFFSIKFAVDKDRSTGHLCLICVFSSSLPPKLCWILYNHTQDMLSAFLNLSFDCSSVHYIWSSFKIPFLNYIFILVKGINILSIRDNTILWMEWH
jgi:hypothetical protein